jgi:hypothetical protein
MAAEDALLRHVFAVALRPDQMPPSAPGASEYVVLEALCKVGGLWQNRTVCPRPCTPVHASAWQPVWLCGSFTNITAAGTECSYGWL